jgi:predicted PurR-regulated permease PerM
LDEKGSIMKRYMAMLFLGICMASFFAPVPGYAVEAAPRISDREIIESLTRLEEGVKANREMILVLRKDMGSMRNEMGSMRNEMGSMRNEIGSMRTEILGFMKWGFGLLFSGMLILVGFILWDRRSTLKPVKDELDDLERRKVDRIIAAMKKLSEEDSRIAQVLRSVGLL